MAIEHFIFETLEPRTMLSADPFGLSESVLETNRDTDIASDTFDNHLNVTNMNAALLPEPIKLAGADDGQIETQPASIASLNLSAERRTELIVIDESIDDYQALLGSIDLNTAGVHYEIQFIDSNSAAIAQLTDIISQYDGLNAVHLFSHATQGAINIGNQSLDEATLLENSEAIGQWSDAFNENADFLLYGCNIASGVYGVQFVETLAALTQLDVAASDDLSGSSALGGDWQLEHNVGNVSTNLQFNETSASWQGTLALVPIIANNALVISQGADVILDATNIEATGNNSAENAATNFTVSNVVGGYFANASDLTVPITSFIQSQISSSEIHFIHDGGELSPAYDLVATSGANSTAADSATVDFTNTSAGALWLNLEGEVSSSNTIPGLSGTTIEKGDIIQQAGPNFSMGEDTTDGTFSTAFDISLFSAEDSTNGLHFVSSTITIGTTNAITLQAGDLILSSKLDMVLSSNGAGSPADLTLGLDSLVYFRPDTAGDYSKGNFYTLLDDPFGDNAEIRAVTLVEKDVMVGDYQLKQGDFLFGRNQGDKHSDIWLFRSEGIDPSNTTTYPTIQTLINGEDINVDIEGKISGIDLLEADRNIGGIDYDAGTLFVSIEQGDDDGVGTNDQRVTKYDIVAFFFSKTTLISGVQNAQATASILFDGTDDVNIDSGFQRINGFSLAYAPEVENTAPSLTANNFTFTEGQTTVITSSVLAATDTESSDMDITFSLSAITGGEFQLTSNLGVAVTSFSQSNIANAELIFVDDDNEQAPTFNISISDNVNITSPVAATINYSSVNDEPNLALNSSTVNFIEDSTPVLLFSGASADTIELGQSFNGLSFTVSNALDGVNELLNIDGSALSLVNGSGTTTNNNFAYNISLVAGTATITLSNGNVSAADVDTLFNTLSYQNNSQDPTEASRVVTLTSLQDDGGVANGGDNTVNPNIAATVTVLAVNDSSVLVNSTFEIEQGQVINVSANNLSIFDYDDSTVDTRFNIVNISGGYFENIATPGVKLTSFSQAQIDAGLINFVDDGNASKPSISFTLTDGKVTTSAFNATINYSATVLEETFNQRADISFNPVVIEQDINIVEVVSETIELEVEVQINERFTAAISNNNVATLDTNIIDSNREPDEQVSIALEIPLPDTTTNALSFAVSAIVASTAQLTSNWSAVTDPLLLLKSSNFLDSLNKANTDVERIITIDAFNLGTGTVFSAGLSVGYVAWLLRSGIILTSVLSSLPAWRFIDPLPILSNLGAFDANQETLEDIITDQSHANPLSEDNLSSEEKS